MDSHHSVRLNAADLRNIQDVLNRFRSDLLTPFLRDVGQRLVNDFKMGFRRSKAPDDTPWKPVQRGGKPLIDTGRLRNSIHANVQPRKLEIGTNVKYAATHQFGDDRTITANVPEHTRLINRAFGKALRFGVYANVSAHQRNQKRNIDARPFLGIESRQRRKIIKEFNHHIELITKGKATGA